MFEGLLKRLNLPRIAEFLSGVVLATILVTRYYDKTGKGKYLLEYLLSWNPLFIFVTIFLFLLAARLIAGKPKDYLNFFLRIMVKIFGKLGKK
ncbi:MAG TPA: hypothetical protein VFP87_06220 [Chitinophagaceae bacterium]|nr:hypothetical protein [Chitinophagaceae bacterium]